MPLEFPRDLDNVGSSGLGAFSRQHHTALPVPFSQLHYDMMLHKFGLPKSTSLALKSFDISSNSSFQVSEIESCWEPSEAADSRDPIRPACPKRIGMSFILPLMSYLFQVSTLAKWPLSRIFWPQKFKAEWKRTVPDKTGRWGDNEAEYYSRSSFSSHPSRP